MPACFKRDMDLIRSLLLEIEGGKRAFEITSVSLAPIFDIDPLTALSDEDAARMDHHLDLLSDAGFVEFERLNGGVWLVKRMTWKGHEFLETVRDGEVWKRTRAGLTKVGNTSLTMVLDLAKAYAKHIASEKLGLKLD